MVTGQSAGGDPTTAKPAADPATGWRELYLDGLITLGYLSYNLTKAVLSILLEPVKREFGMSDTMAGLLSGPAMTLPIALCCIPLGMLADRRSRLPLVGVLIVGWSLMTGLAGLATGLLLLFVSRAATGAFQAGYTPVAMSLLTDAFTPRRRATVMGIYNLGGAAGTMIALGVGGIVAERLGWRTAFFMAAIPGVVVAGLAVLTLREPRRGRFDAGSEAAPAASFAEAARLFRTVPGLAAIGAGMTLAVVALAVLSIWIPSLLIRTQGMSLRQAGPIAGLIYGVGCGVGPLIGGWLSDRLGKGDPARGLWVPVASLTAAGITGLFAVLVASGPASMVVALGLACVLQTFYMGVGYATVATLAGQRARGAVMSILLVGFNVLAYGFGAFVIGWLSDLLTPVAGQRAIAWAFSSAFVLSFCAALAFWRGLVAIRNSATS